MPDAVLAAAFVMMLITPCVIAFRTDRRKSKGTPGPHKGQPDHAVNLAPPANAARPPLPRRPSRPPVTAALIGPTQSAEQPPDQLSGEAEIEALLSQAATAKAHAIALYAAAQTAAVKAEAAAQLAAQTARAAALAHEAAAAERAIQARTTVEEQARKASGENRLPETHPSLDFPRSGRPRRAA